MASDDIPVLIVGGGPVGLATSILCSFHGIRSLLVECHPGTSIYPKARYINERTMEILRQAGAELAIRETEIFPAGEGQMGSGPSVSEIGRPSVEANGLELVRGWSPTWSCTSAQDIFEPVLLKQARVREPARIRHNTELLSFEQYEDHVVARLADRERDTEWDVQARYLIGADGADSRVREALGIRMVGQPVLSNFINILFRTDLARWTGNPEFRGGFITNSEAPGLLLYNGGDRWRFQVRYFPDKGERPEDFPAERCLRLIRIAVGVPDLPLELEAILHWNEAALVAEHFGDHRVFLVGDAEHVMSPAGGFGMNLGIQNAHNLIWKVAAVLNGWASPALLATYDEERAPIVREMTETTAHNLAASRAAGGRIPVRPASLFTAFGWVFGATYASGAIVPDGTPPAEVANPKSDYNPNARPGSRAPHAWLERGEGQERISTLDLFNSGFTLLAGSSGEIWCEAARAVSGDLGIPLSAHLVGPAGDLVDASGVWKALYGVDAGGAVLVRPDGYVAWRSRSRSDQARPVLEGVLRRVLDREG